MLSTTAHVGQNVPHLTQSRSRLSKPVYVLCGGIDTCNLVQSCFAVSLANLPPSSHFSTITPSPKTVLAMIPVLRGAQKQPNVFEGPASYGIYGANAQIDQIESARLPYQRILHVKSVTRKDEMIGTVRSIQMTSSPIPAYTGRCSACATTVVAYAFDRSYGSKCNRKLKLLFIF